MFGILLLEKNVVNIAKFTYFLLFYNSQIIPRTKNDINLKKKKLFLLIFLMSFVGTVCATCTATGYPYFVLVFLVLLS